MQFLIVGAVVFLVVLGVFGAVFKTNLTTGKA